jgi:CheY-like chemotaxis protein
MFPADDLPEAPKHLLLVEDESVIALSESLMLKDHGYMVDIARTGEAAVDFLAKGKIPDLILMDIDLGRGMDGMEAARAILEIRDLPVVFLTSHNSAEMFAKVRGVTRYGCLPKSSADSVILSTIESALELFHKEGALMERDRLLAMVEESARIGYWFVREGSSSIEFSVGCRSILGRDGATCSFEEFAILVAEEDGERRATAFRALLETGKPYDSVYRLYRGDTGAGVRVRSLGRKVGSTVFGVIQDVSGDGTAFPARWAPNSPARS